MIRRGRGRGADAKRGEPTPTPGGESPQSSPPPSPWTPEKVGAVLAAFRSFVSNQAQKHGVPASEVWALVRDEVLDPGGG